MEHQEFCGSDRYRAFFPKSATTIWLNTANLPQRGVSFRRPDLPNTRV